MSEEWNIEGVEFKNVTDLIEANYAGQFPRQMPIWLSINWDTKEIWAYADGSNNMTMNEFHKIVNTFKLPDGVDASTLKDFVVEKLIPLLDMEVSCFSVEWDAHNYVGRWDYKKRSYDESYVIYDIQKLIDDEINEFSQGGLWDFVDWMNGYYQDIFDEMDDGGDLETIVERYFEEAKEENVVFVDSVDSVVELLEDEYEEYKEENDE